MIWTTSYTRQKALLSNIEGLIGVLPKELAGPVVQQSDVSYIINLMEKFGERFNGSYRREVLDAYLFLELEEARELTEQWVEENNSRRPHEALGNLSPSEWPLRSRSGKMQNSPDGTKPSLRVYHMTT